MSNSHLEVENRDLRRRIERLEQALKEHERMLNELAQRTNFNKVFGPGPGPSVDPSYMQYHINMEDFKSKPHKCAKCGLDLTQTMCYSCPDSKCPCGMGPVMC